MATTPVSVKPVTDLPKKVAAWISEFVGAFHKEAALVMGVLVAMGIVPSPLRAVAAPFPMLFAYDVAVRPTTTTVLGAHEAVRSEAERPRFNDYECMRGGYDDPSNAPVMAGAGGVHA